MTTINGAAAFREEPLVQVRRVYVAFAQGLFHAAPLGSYHWEPDIKTTEIVITDENPINLSAVGKRPAISFTRSPVQFCHVGIDDLDKYDFYTGSKQKAILIPGTMCINFCSRNDLESENLAWIYAEQLWMHRMYLIQAGMFEIGRSIVVGSPSPPGSIVQNDGGEEWYVTTIQSPFQFSRTSRATPLGAQIVQEISMRMHIGEHANVDKGPVLDPSGANLPYEFVEENYGQETLPKVKDPRDPTREVFIRSLHPYRPGLRGLTIRGRPIPIQRADVEDSGVAGSQTKVCV